MENSASENGSSDRRRAVNELVRGLDFTQQLQALLNSSRDNNLSSSSDDLVWKILTSFTNTISMVNSSAFDEVSQIPVSSCENSPWKSEDSSDSCKSSALKDRRGCYKRRKTSNTWTRESSSLLDDGHAWRKYGQKVILNAVFPRSYFRCTHKTDQGCPASKQVQRMEQDPPKYRTTYYGQHTCSRSFKSPAIILDSKNPSDSSTLLRFDGPICHDERGPFFPCPPLVKQEAEVKEDSSHTVSDVTYNYSSSSDYLVSLESNLDFMVGCVEFDDDLDLEF